MDVLEFAFESDFLKNLQSEIRSFSSNRSHVLIIGDSGSGKTTWSQVICRFDGLVQVVENHDAPKTLKGWKEISQNWDKNAVILEDIDKWNVLTQSSFIQFFKEQKQQLKRLISTSSGRLVGKIREGHFRSEIYYALAVRKIELPKLNECLVDFDKIINFWSEVNGLMSGFAKVQLSDAAFQKLKAHRWPGNFTELVNVLERAMSLSQGNVDHQHIQFDIWGEEYSALEAGLTLAEVEKKLIKQTLNLTAQNKSQAARMLGISIRTLRNKLNEYRNEFKQGVTHELV